MKKILSILFIVLFLGVFFAVNFSSFQDSFYKYRGNQMYSIGNYQQAIEYHGQMDDNETKYFLLGNDYYKLDNYKAAAQQFSKIKTYRGLYNAGNALYRFGENTDSTDEKIDFWTRALQSYTKSLEQKDTSQARDNYNTVKEKLDELLAQKEEEEQEDTQKQDSQQQSDDNSDEDGDSSQSDEDQQSKEQSSDDQDDSESEQKNTSIIPQPRGEEYKLGQDLSVPEMTAEEREDLEEYIDYLKSVEKQNQQFFNKPGEESFSRDAFDSFFNPFKGFDDRLDAAGEKDW